MSAEILNITAEESGERIDALLARSLTELSRSAAQRLIEEGRVTLDGRPVKKNKKTEAGEVYELELPEPVLPEPLPQDIPLEVVYEDADAHRREQAARARRTPGSGPPGRHARERPALPLRGKPFGSGR